MRVSGILAGSLLVLVGLPCAQADDVNVAVAANFTAPMNVSPPRSEYTGHKAKLASFPRAVATRRSKTARPFRLFVSAYDELRPIGSEGLLNASAIHLRHRHLVRGPPNPFRRARHVLSPGKFPKLAIANPKTAPYGRAAIETLTKLGLLATVEPKFVQGENIAQTFQFAQTGNADLGLVALSQVMKEGKVTEGSAWVVPAEMHEPIRQDVILLSTGRGNAAAEALLKYLRTDKAKTVIRSFGYGP